MPWLHLDQALEAYQCLKPKHSHYFNSFRAMMRTILMILSMGSLHLLYLIHYPSKNRLTVIIHLLRLKWLPRSRISLKNSTRITVKVRVRPSNLRKRSQLDNRFLDLKIHSFYWCLTINRRAWRGGKEIHQMEDQFKEVIGL